MHEELHSHMFRSICRINHIVFPIRNKVEAGEHSKYLTPVTAFKSFSSTTWILPTDSNNVVTRSESARVAVLPKLIPAI
jgi:hypothetical protein